MSFPSRLHVVRFTRAQTRALRLPLREGDLLRVLLRVAVRVRLRVRLGDALRVLVHEGGAVLVAVAWVALVGWTVVATVGNGVAGIWSDCRVYET